MRRVSRGRKRKKKVMRNRKNGREVNDITFLFILLFYFLFFESVMILPKRIHKHKVDKPSKALFNMQAKLMFLIIVQSHKPG